MSIDVNQHGSTMPGAAPPKKSGGGMKWVIIGGLGCLGVVGICIAGIVGMGFWGLNMVQSNPEFLSSKAAVESSADIQGAVGNPVTVGDASLPQPDPSGRQNTFVLTAPVTGPDGSGTMRWLGQMSEDGQTWTTLELTVDAGGTTYDLKDDADFDLDIDLGN
ncbi:MAG: hypothetical protein AAF456_20260 [Planctomycetota bacterium]